MGNSDKSVFVAVSHYTRLHYTAFQ